jgi:LuxR family maltose regulon positive regulatory protein
MHLVLISRREPPISLIRLRARRQVTEVRTLGLRFTEEETAAFVQQEMGIPINADMVGTLQQRVEGWVTGLRLVTLSLRQRDSVDLSPERLQGSTSHVTEYLVTEVLASQPQAIQDYLLNTAILNRFCAPLCQAVQFGSAESQSSSSGTAVYQGSAQAATETKSDGLTGQDFLGWQEENDPFLVRLDDQGHWFRYHHLFQDLLQRRLREERGAKGVATLHGRDLSALRHDYPADVQRGCRGSDGAYCGGDRVGYQRKYPDICYGSGDWCSHQLYYPGGP